MAMCFIVLFLMVASSTQVAGPITESTSRKITSTTMAPNPHSDHTPTPCDNQDCTKHGTCKSLSPHSYTCTCNPGFTGKDCETKLLCTTSPCKHDGFCIDTDSGKNYTCDCLPGYEGWNCTAGPCASFHCNNEGTCQSQDKNNTKAVCSCPSGFSGDHCENRAQGLNMSPILLTVLMVPIFSMFLLP